MNLAPNWRDFESMEDAARRLIGVMDERAKKRRLAGGHERPAEIHETSTQSLVAGENAEERSHKGSGRLDAPPQRSAAGGWEEDGGIGNTGGQTDFGRGSSLKYKDTARPNSERTSLFTDRTDLEGPMLRRIE
jgi:hypothetical protein